VDEIGEGTHEVLYQVFWDEPGCRRLAVLDIFRKILRRFRQGFCKLNIVLGRLEEDFRAFLLALFIIVDDKDVFFSIGLGLLVKLKSFVSELLYNLHGVIHLRIVAVHFPNLFVIILLNYPKNYRVNSQSNGCKNLHSFKCENRGLPL
jgi:hypothetical protein